MIPPQILAGGALLLTVAGFGAGWQVQGWRCAAAREDALREAQNRFQQQLAEQNREAQLYEQERETARVTSRDRQERLRVIYRDRPVPPDCEPPADALGVLREAVGAANADPAEPRQSVR